MSHSYRWMGHGCRIHMDEWVIDVAFIWMNGSWMSHSYGWMGHGCLSKESSPDFQSHVDDIWMYEWVTYWKSRHQTSSHMRITCQRLIHIYKWVMDVKFIGMNESWMSIERVVARLPHDMCMCIEWVMDVYWKGCHQTSSDMWMTCGWHVNIRMTHVLKEFVTRLPHDMCVCIKWVVTRLPNHSCGWMGHGCLLNKSCASLVTTHLTCTHMEVYSRLDLQSCASQSGGAVICAGLVTTH